MTSPSLDPVQEARENVVGWAQGCAEAADDGEGSALMSYHRDFLRLLAAFESTLLTSLIRECEGMREEMPSFREDGETTSRFIERCGHVEGWNAALNRTASLLRARLNGRTE